MRAVAFVACVMVVGAGCDKPPPECDESALGAATKAEAASEKLYARAAVQKALDAAVEARAAVEAEAPRFAVMRDYDKAGALCKEAQQLATAASAAVDGAKKRRAEIDAMMVGMNSALDEAGVQLIAGRALLEAVPQAALDEKMRGIGAAHRGIGTQANGALALIQGSGWADDAAPLIAHKTTAEDVHKQAQEIVLAIRRGATEQCKPLDGKTPLFFGARARAHDGFALVEAGPAEDNAHGFVAVITRTAAGGCRTLDVKAVEPGADPTRVAWLEPGVVLKTWGIGGAIPVRLLFAWSERNALFAKDDGGTWAFDAGKVIGFSDCAAVTCTPPEVTGDHIDASCACSGPKDPNQIDLTRAVRFSWHGNAVLAER